MTVLRLGRGRDGMAAVSRDLPMEELVEGLRKAGAIWLRNSDLLLLEELIRRVHLMQARRVSQPELTQ